MNVVTLTADVYVASNIGGVEAEPYLWDLGAFICIGSKTEPYRKIGGHEEFAAAMDDTPIDAAWKEDQDSRRVEVTVYEHDYGVYMETGRSDPNYVAFDDVVWRITEETPIPDKDDAVFTLTAQDARGESASIRRSTLDKKVENDNAHPVARIGN